MLRKIGYLLVLVLILQVGLFADTANVRVVNDDDYFENVHELLSNASESIFIIMFSAYMYDRYPNSPSNILFRDLAKAKRKGVDVKIILNQDKSGGSFLSLSKLSPDNLNRVVVFLKDNGIDYKLDAKNITTHAKLIVVDRKYVVVGSTNWSYSGITKNHEANVIVRSDRISKKFIRYFDKLWNDL